MISEKELDNAIKNMLRRHILEDWMFVRNASNNQKTMYISKEGFDWLKEVYFNKTGYYLDLDISFFEKQIKQKEQELNLSHKKKDYFDSSITDLMRMFNKSKTAVKTAISRMTKRTGINYKYILDGEIIIKAAGVKWLYEKHFRLAYLEYLENYKLDLDKKVLELYGR